MRKLITLFAVLTTLHLSAYENVDFEVDLGIGYRQDNFNWSIGNHHALISKLDWKNLQMIQYRADLRGFVGGNFYVRGYADYAHTFSGTNTDSDYYNLVDEETGNLVKKNALWLKTKQKAGKGEAFDFSFGIGYLFDFLCKRLTFAPMVGYSYHEQHLRMFKGKVVFDLVDNIVGEFPNLHSNYRARWQGPWLGFDTAYEWDCSIKFFGGFEYHWADYNASGHWNLRKDFTKDFQHKGNNGYGLIGTLGASYDFWDCWTAGIMANYQTWHLKNGRDKTFLNPVVADAYYSGNLSPVTNLHQVNWNSYSINAFAGFYF